MIWSERFKLWVDPDNRSPERRAQDEAIARSVEADQERLKEVLRRAEAAQVRQANALDRAAESLAVAVLRELVGARKNAGFSQSEVARRMDVPQSAVVRLESGAHSPTLTTLTRYAAAIGVRMEVRRLA
ncbi:MAG TPA: helix-turn-helix domain-containing protein [Planctomycetota bacterium]